MATTTKQVNRPPLSQTGEQILAQYEQQLRIEEDLALSIIRNYLSYLRQLAAWSESVWEQGRKGESSFASGVVIPLTITDYRIYLQQELHLKPNSVNRN